MADMNGLDPLTTDLEKKTKVFLSLVEEEQSPIKSSLSDVPALRDAYSELRNLARALDQYARTAKGLRYIGLMGTFSSSKSSIINSLLAQDVRAADLPPIDDEITNLTHPSNRKSLLGAHSRGLLKVTTQPVEAELLQNCFLVDTPGSGDPEVREGRDMEVAQENWTKTIELAQAKFVANVSVNRLQVLKGLAARLSGVLGIAMFLGVLATVGIFVSGLQGQIGWALTILSGALTTVTASVFGWGWKKVSTSKIALPKTRWRIAHELTERSEARIETAVAGASALEIKDGFASAVTDFLAKDREDKLPQYVLLGETEYNLMQSEAKYRRVYFHEWENLATGMNDWYRPDEFKRNLISDAATSIKQRAIEPALKLFGDRLNDVQNFSERLRALSI
jgi:hypothetical protein